MEPDLRLLCSRCDAEWPFHRVVCPFCGNATGVSHYASRPGYRLYVCDACRRYLKVADWRDLATEHPPPVERVLTMGLDLAARAAGWGEKQE